MGLGKVNGVYRLSQDVELKYLPTGSALAKLNLVNSNKYKTQSGEQKEDTCFIEGSVFGKLAEIANQYLRKGSKVYIDAELKQDTWTAQDGTNRSKHSLKINSFEMLDSKSDNQQHKPQNNMNPPVSYEKQTQDNILEAQAMMGDIDEDSIPFAPIGLQYPAILHSCLYDKPGD